MAEPSKQSWWHTIPGILTAVAGLITAVTGMIIALHQIGVFGGESETSTAATQQSSTPASTTTTAENNTRLGKAKELAANAHIISPAHLSARGYLEQPSPKICIGSEYEEQYWKNLLSAVGVDKPDIDRWVLALGYFAEPMTDGSCRLTLYSSEQASRATELIADLNQIGGDPPYRSEAFLDLFEEWELEPN